MNFQRSSNYLRRAGETTAGARESIYLLSKVPGSPLMQTNGDVASLFSVVRLPGVGPEAAWNLSSLDPAWGEGQFLLIYLAKQTHVPPTLALKRGCTAVAPLPLPRPSPPAPAAVARSPGAFHSAPKRAPRSLEVRAVPARRPSHVDSVQKYAGEYRALALGVLRVKGEGWRGSPVLCSRPLRQSRSFRTPDSANPRSVKGAAVWQAVLRPPG